MAMKKDHALENFGGGFGETFNESQAVYFGGSGDPGFSSDFIWRMYKSDFTMSSVDTNKSVQKYFSDLWTSEEAKEKIKIICSRAQKVKLPKREYEIGYVEYGSLQVPFIKQQKLHPIEVTYLEDESDLAFWFHNYWHDQVVSHSGYTVSTDSGFKKENPTSLSQAVADSFSGGGIFSPESVVKNEKGKNTVKALSVQNNLTFPLNAYDGSFTIAPIANYCAVGSYCHAVLKNKMATNRASQKLNPFFISWMISLTGKQAIAENLGSLMLDDPFGQDGTMQTIGSIASGAASIAAAAGEAVQNLIDVVIWSSSANDDYASTGYFSTSYATVLFPRIFPVVVEQSEADRSKVEFNTVKVTYQRIPTLTWGKDPSINFNPEAGATGYDGFALSERDSEQGARAIYSQSDANSENPDDYNTFMSLYYRSVAPPSAKK